MSSISLYPSAGVHFTLILSANPNSKQLLFCCLKNTSAYDPHKDRHILGMPYTRPLQSYLSRLSPKDRLDRITVFCEVWKQNDTGNGGEGSHKVS